MVKRNKLITIFICLGIVISFVSFIKAFATETLTNQNLLKDSVTHFNSFNNKSNSVDELENQKDFNLIDQKTTYDVVGGDPLIDGKNIYVLWNFIKTTGYTKLYPGIYFESHAPGPFLIKTDAHSGLGYQFLGNKVGGYDFYFDVRLKGGTHYTAFLDRADLQGTRSAFFKVQETKESPNAIKEITPQTGKADIYSSIYQKNPNKISFTLNGEPYDEYVLRYYVELNGESNQIVGLKTLGDWGFKKEWENTETPCSIEMKPAEKEEILKIKFFKKNGSTYPVGTTMRIVSKDKKWNDITGVVDKNGFLNLELKQLPQYEYDNLATVFAQEKNKKESISSLDFKIATQLDVDKTPPTVSKFSFLVNINDSESIINANYEKFVEAFDNVSQNNLTYKLITNNEELKEKLKKVQSTSFKLGVSDEAGNQTISDIPIFVKDDKTRWSFNLLEEDREIPPIYKDGYALRATDFTSTTVEYPNTITDLKKFILKNSNTQLWELIFSELGFEMKTDNIEIDITNLPPIDKIPESGTYPVELLFKDTKNNKVLKRTIKMTLKDVESSVKVRFVDENQKDLLEPYIIKGIAGKTIDLTSDTYDVSDFIERIEEKRYILSKRPENERKIPIKREQYTVNYQFKGTLVIDSFPTKINFGSLPVSQAHSVIENAIYNTPLVIKDTRKDKSEWNFSVKLVEPLVSSHDPNKIIHRALRFRDKQSHLNPLLVGQSYSIKSYTPLENDPGEYNLNDEWNKEKTGLALYIPSDHFIQPDTYQSKLRWILQQVP